MKAVRESLFPPQSIFAIEDSGWLHVTEKRHKNSLPHNLTLSVVASEFRSMGSSLVKRWMPPHTDHLEASRSSSQERGFLSLMQTRSSLCV